MKSITLIKLAPLAIAASMLGTALLATPAFAEVGVTNSYSTRCITNGKYRSDFASSESFNGVRNSYESALKVEVGSDKKHSYIATSKAYQETKGSFNSFSKVSGSNDYDYKGTDYSHTVSSFAQ